jgi:hypothetical protein
MRILLLASCLLLSACDRIGLDRNSDGGPNRSYSISAFTGLTVAGPHDVIVTYGPTHSVRAEGDPDILDRLTINSEDGELWVGARRDSMFNTGGGKAVVYVTVPRLESATIGGSGDLRIDRTESPSFEGTIGGSGNLQIGALTSRNAKFTIAGSGDLKVKGATDQGEFRIAGSGDVQAAEFKSRTAAISIAGSGSVTAQATESATISIMGSGDVDVSGTDRCTINKLGSGNVTCHAVPSDKKA